MNEEIVAMAKNDEWIALIEPKQTVNLDEVLNLSSS